jgi:hypothetical protein
MGRATADACVLTPEKMIAALGGIPDDKRHCADMAVAALRDALKE